MAGTYIASIASSMFCLEGTEALTEDSLYQQDLPQCSNSQMNESLTMLLLPLRRRA